MTFEPSWALNIVLVCGLAAFYLWYLLAEAGITEPVVRKLRQNDTVWKLIGCPFCAGFWLTGLLLLVTQSYDPVTHLAATGVCGVTGRVAP